MKTIEVQGFSKAKAFEQANLNVDIEMLKNATIAWKKAGSPMSGKNLNEFLTSYLKSKKAVGGYLVIDAASDDTRTRPYSVINEVTDGKRKSKTFYQVKEADLKVKYTKEVNEEGVEIETPKVTVVSVGATVGKAERKEAAMKLMKENVDLHKRDFLIEIAKEVVEGKKYAGYGIYTPSKSAKLGKFLFFVAE